MKYYPKSKIITGLYTAGKEWMYETGEEYIGPYFKVPDGVFEGNKPTEGSSALLIPLKDYSAIPGYNPAGNYEYDRLQKSTDVKGLQPPPTGLPVPTANDYQIGYLKRYFTRKKNDQTNLIIEISGNVADRINRGQLGNFYYVISLKWKISGPKWDQIGDKGQIVDPGVIDSNRKTLFYKEREMPGIRYKNQNLLKFSIYPGFANINDYTTEDQGFTG